MSDNKQLQLLEKVNALKKASKIGVEELSDVAKLYFEIAEEVEAENVTGEATSIMAAIAELIRPLASAYSGYEQLPAEASDLQDDEIAQLLSYASFYKLGENAPRYTQGLKMVLVALQTYFVFNGKLM